MWVFCEKGLRSQFFQTRFGPFFATGAHNAWLDIQPFDYLGKRGEVRFVASSVSEKECGRTKLIVINRRRLNAQKPVTNL